MAGLPSKGKRIWITKTAFWNLTVDSAVKTFGRCSHGWGTARYTLTKEVHMECSKKVKSLKTAAPVAQRSLLEIGSCSAHPVKDESKRAETAKNGRFSLLCKGDWASLTSPTNYGANEMWVLGFECLKNSPGQFCSYCAWSHALSCPMLRTKWRSWQSSLKWNRCALINISNFWEKVFRAWVDCLEAPLRPAESHAGNNEGCQPEWQTYGLVWCISW